MEIKKFKDVFLIDYVCNTNNIIDYPNEGSYLDKFLFYRSLDGQIDIDSSEIVCEFYNLLLNKNYEIKNQIKDAKKNIKYKYLYELVCDDISNIKCIRGETYVNCMQIILQIVNLFCNEEIIYSTDKQLIENMTNEVKNTNVTLYNLINEHIRLCYTFGNFIPIPFISGHSLNQAKGRLKEKGISGNCMVDSSYTYTKILKDYIDNDCIFTHPILCFQKTINMYSDFYKSFVDNGKNHYFDRMLLMSFMKDDVPIKFMNYDKDEPIENIICYLVSINYSLNVRNEEIFKYIDRKSN